MNKIKTRMEIIESGKIVNKMWAGKFADVLDFLDYTEFKFLDNLTIDDIEDFFYDVHIAVDRILKCGTTKNMFYVPVEIAKKIANGATFKVINFELICE